MLISMAAGGLKHSCATRTCALAGIHANKQTHQYDQQVNQSRNTHAGDHGGLCRPNHGESHCFCRFTGRQANHRGSDFPCQKGELPKHAHYCDAFYKVSVAGLPSLDTVDATCIKQ